jgi:hypothetical protein
MECAATYMHIEVFSWNEIWSAGWDGTDLRSIKIESPDLCFGDLVVPMYSDDERRNTEVVSFGTWHFSCLVGAHCILYSCCLLL